MCGRYATTRSATDLSALFEASDETGDGLAADYNVAPTRAVPIVRGSGSAGTRVLSTARWGFVPPWAKDPSVGARMINARGETVAATRSYAPSFASRRCLVPADGWYEWVRRSPRERQPYYMTRSDGAGLAFAGLWTVWGEDKLLTCTIVTTAAVGELATVHDRMPLMLPPERWRDWLDADAATASALLGPPPAGYLDAVEIRPVGAAVGNVRNKGPQLIERVPAAPLHAPAERPQDLTLFD
ncbi:SOS response-associated peptidase [Planosporangium sp. 12N6]|uniref:SOS response-associated peptidase n=1 Tax=Planosporangium spinosum TaxID=3402278 RepID=UPI003CF0F592